MTDMVNHPPKMSQSDLARFWSYVDKSGPCWIWQGSVAARRGGYGQFNVRGRVCRSHRVAWQAAKGPIPAGLFVCHRCDNPPCCNPAHLFLGTVQENTRDMRRKGRGYDIPPRRGREAASAKLSEAVVTQMRRDHASGIVTMYQLAKTHGVTLQAISSVIHRRTWKHVL